MRINADTSAFRRDCGSAAPAVMPLQLRDASTCVIRGFLYGVLTAIVLIALRLLLWANDTPRR
jgi:hypothetical protein